MQDIKTIFYFAPSLTEYQSRWAAGEISPRTIVFIPPTAEGDSGLIYKGNVLYGKSTDDNVREIVKQLLAEDTDILPVATKYNLGGVIVGDFLKANASGKLDVDTQAFFADLGVKEYIKYIISESYIKGIMTSDYIKSILNLSPNNDPYTLPAATEEVLGGIKVGSYLKARVDGTLSVNYTSLLNTLAADPVAIAAFRSNSIPIATASDRGGIKIGAGFSMSGNDLDVLNINDNYIRTLIGGGGISVATPTSLGGIVLFSDSETLPDKHYAVKLDGDTNKAYVHVPWTANEITPSEVGIQRTYFTNVETGTVPNSPTTNDYQSVSDRFKVGTVLWTSTNVNPTNAEDTYAMWAWIRNGVCISIDGPVKISSPSTGGNGEDSEEIEWIYTRSQTEWSSDDISRIGSYLEDYDVTYKVSGTVTIGGIVWNDHPSGIDNTYKYEYASFRPSKNIDGRRVWGQVGFSNPLLWSAYGKQGLDGDGVEYIYYVGAFAPSGTVYDPTMWTAVQEAEYTGPDGSPWTDDPSNLTIQGQKQWVSVRKKKNGEWGTFCTPALWSYFAQDGVVDGYTVDLINENMPVGTDNQGTVTSYSNKCKVQVFHNATQLTYTSAAGSPESGYFKVSYGTITRSDASAATGISVSNIALDSNNAHDAVITVSMTNVSDFEAVNAYVPITVELPDGSTRELVATLYGVSFGEAGASYDMWTSVHSVHSNHNGSSVNPSIINVGLQIGTGSDQYQLQKLGQDTVNSNFSFQYAIDDSQVFTPMDATTRPTISVPTGNHTSITVLMKYGNQVVDSDTIWYVKDGEPGISPLAPDVYNVSIVLSDITVNKDSLYSGQLKFGITHNGNPVTSIPQNWTLSVRIGSQSTTAILNTSTSYWEAEITTPQTYVSGTTPPYSSVTLKNDVNTVMASGVAPFIIVGPKGQPGDDGIGIKGQSSYKSTMFVRMNSTPLNVPEGGSYSNPSPGGCLAGRNSLGVPQYWTDGIPSGEEIVWASTRIFTSDGLSPQQAQWQPARKMTDTAEYDVEFAFQQPDDEMPVAPDPGINTHEHTSEQIWFDPDKDKNNLPSGKTWSDMVWRAERQKKNGQYVGEWVITRIKGEKGDTGESVVTTIVQPLEYPVIRIRGEWSSSPSMPYNDGSAEHAENSIRYIDVVSYSGLYFKCISYGTTVRPCDASLVTTSDWQRFAIAEDTAFNTLIANNAYINSLTSKQVVVTNNSNIPVGGMVSGSSIPTLLGDRTNNNGIRIFAGPVSSTGDISTAPFTVDNEGHVKASSVDIHGNVDGNVSGSFITTGEGYKLMLQTTDGTAMLKVYHPDNSTHPAEEINLYANYATGASLDLYSIDWRPTGTESSSTGSHCQLDPDSVKFWNYRNNGKDQVGILIDSLYDNPSIYIKGETFGGDSVSGSIKASEITFLDAAVTVNNIRVKDPTTNGLVDLLERIKAIEARINA